MVGDFEQVASSAHPEYTALKKASMSLKRYLEHGRRGALDEAERLLNKLSGKDAGNTA